MWNKFTNKQTPSSVFECWACFLDPAFVIDKNKEILNELSNKKQNKTKQPTKQPKTKQQQQQQPSQQCPP